MKNLDDWYIFENSILSDIEISDCNDTVTGRCEQTSNLKDCVKLCEQYEKDCKIGYFIETDERNFCIPVLHHPYTITSPYYRLRDKSYYPELESFKSTVFSNKQFYPYPPRNSMKIFYRDQFFLKNIETGLYLNMDKEKVVLKDEGLVLQFLSSTIKRNKILDYLMIENGDSLVLNVPRTALVFNYNGEDTFIWKMRAYNIGTENDTIQIHSFNSSEISQHNKELDYKDKLYFTFGGKIILCDKGKLILSELDVKTLSENGENIFFHAIPKFPLYKLENGKCKETDYNESLVSSSPFHELYRNSNCWIKKKKTRYDLILFIFCLFFIMVIFLVFKKVGYKNS